MRKKLLYEGANKLEYEIRQIVRKAEKVERAGQKIIWENIGDPIHKNSKIPEWIKGIISDLIKDDITFGYCHSKGIPETREFLAQRNNALNGVQITAEDILFFNGLGDAISKLYQFIPATSRIIGPSPAYSTHSSSEAAHANSDPLTYALNPDNNWYPDIEELYNKVKYNPNIIGILIINPDNPTGMIYPIEYLQKIVKIAKEFDLCLIADEIYMAINYGYVETLPLAKVIEDVPGISLKGISKELPWPGSRCGWMEFYNRDEDHEFSRFCHALEDAKMVEVCSTTLPQKAIPLIFSDDRYEPYISKKNKAIKRRNEIITDILGNVGEIKFNKTQGAFYNTIIFKDDVLQPNQKMTSGNPKIQKLLDQWITDDLPYDRRFAYYLLATKGVCIVPLSSFHSELKGFRVTLLQENEALLKKTFQLIKQGIQEYCNTPMLVSSQT